MFRATEEIYDAFRADNLHCNKGLNGESSYVSAGISTKLVNFKVLFISTDDDSDVAMRVYNFIRFDETKLSAVIAAVNSLNAKFRYIKFIVDTDDNSITISWDFPVRCNNIGDTAVEMTIRLMRMADEAYSELMRTIWAS